MAGSICLLFVGSNDQIIACIEFGLCRHKQFPGVVIGDINGEKFTALPACDKVPGITTKEIAFATNFDAGVFLCFFMQNIKTLVNVHLIHIFDIANDKDTAMNVVNKHRLPVRQGVGGIDRACFQDLADLQGILIDYIQTTQASNV